MRRPARLIENIAPVPPTSDAISPADNKPVFIAGYPRSGTTLVYRILAQSPQFAAVRTAVDASHETAISVYMNPLADLERIYQQVWPDWRAVVVDELQFGRFARRVTPNGPLRRPIERLLTKFVFQDARFLNYPLDVDSLPVRGWFDPARRMAARRAAMAISGRKNVIRQFINLYAQQGRAPRVLEKYPFNYYRFVELLAAMPEARFIFIVRHPCDVFASMVHRARVELADRIPIGRVSWMLLAAETFAADWLNAIRSVKAFQADAPHAILLLKYEELLADPLKVINRLADFAGVPIHELDLQPDDNPADASRRFPISSAFPVANSGTYLGEVHSSDIAAIRNKCAAAMADLGYGTP